MNFWYLGKFQLKLKVNGKNPLALWKPMKKASRCAIGIEKVCYFNLLLKTLNKFCWSETLRWILDNWGNFNSNWKEKKTLLHYESPWKKPPDVLLGFKKYATLSCFPRLWTNFTSRTLREWILDNLGNSYSKLKGNEKILLDY